jgi:restriction system protein
MNRLWVDAGLISSQNSCACVVRGECGLGKTTRHDLALKTTCLNQKVLVPGHGGRMQRLVTTKPTVFIVNSSRTSELVAEEEEDSPDPTSTFEEAEETAWAEIRQTLQEMNPYDFQNLVAALLRAMNYYVSWLSPPGRDGGIDILAYTDLLGTKPRRIKVQVKRRADKTNFEGLRSFMALLGDEDVGLFVSTGGFTSDAEAEACTQEKRKITLLGLERLLDLWVEHYQKINEPDKQLLPLKPIYYLAPAE